MPVLEVPEGGMATMETVGDVAPAAEEAVPEPDPAATEEVEPGAPAAGAAPELPFEEPEDAPPQPAGGSFIRVWGLPAFSTEPPGLGKMMSMSLVSRGSRQAPMLPMLALNMSGKEGSRLKISSEAYSLVVLKNWESSASRFFLPPVTVTGAQFMYISRLPMRLNQVHARVYSPALIP